MLAFTQGWSAKHFYIEWHHKLGAGGEGAVFLARSVTSGRLYAAKVPHRMIPNVSHINFTQELLRVLRVKGNYIARPVAWNHKGLIPFAIYEYADNGSLRDEMRDIFSQKKVYHPEFAAQRVHQILLGINECHQSGLLHRDVKPENFLLYSDGRLKLNDFGLGRSYDYNGLYTTTNFCGTPAYASPEQISSLSIDARSDLYSVGLIAYELLTGFLPRRDGHSFPPSSRNSLVSRAFDVFVSSLISPHRDYRPKTASRAIDMIRSIRQEYNIIKLKRLASLRMFQR